MIYIFSVDAANIYTLRSMSLYNNQYTTILNFCHMKLLILFWFYIKFWYYITSDKSSWYYMLICCTRNIVIFYLSTLKTVVLLNIFVESRIFPLRILQKNIMYLLLLTIYIERVLLDRICIISFMDNEDSIFYFITFWVHILLST